MGLALGGALANRRRFAATEAERRRSIEAADRDLAAAHAEDNGWDRSRLEAAARRVLEQRHPGAAPDDLVLVQVIDRPGTDGDEAIFQAGPAASGQRIVLRRRGDDWVDAG